jgi:fibronectin type 3 domain-containing protein
MCGNRRLRFGTRFFAAYLLAVLTLGGYAGPAFAQIRQSDPGPDTTTLRLAWHPSPDPYVTGYRVYYGTESKKYNHKVEVKGRYTTETTLRNLEKGKTYFFAVTAYTAKGKESPFSGEISNTPYKLPPSRHEATSAEGKILPIR